MDSDTGSVLAGFIYGEPVAGLIQAFKFHADLGAGRMLARLALPAFADSTPQALIPVPLHTSRLRQRGYNQALELARYWGKCRAIPVLPHILIRARATQTQSSLPAFARQNNINRAFLARGTFPAHIALIDDVVTTGSTCGEAARIALEAGAERVDVWSLARVP